MTTVLLIACIGNDRRLFILLGLTPMEFTAAVFGKLTDRPKSLRDEVGESPRRKKQSYLRREIARGAIHPLKVPAGRRAFPCLRPVLLCFAVGASIAVMLSNFFPCSCHGGLYVPCPSGG